MDEASATVVFGELSVKEVSADLPLMGLPPDGLHPSAEVGRQRVKVQLQAVAGENGQAIWSQHFHESMHDGMGHRLSARPNFEYGNDFGASIDGEPDPESVSALAGPGAQFIQLDVPELQAVE